MKLPGRNFARFILMVFILFSLVMRTAYQGKQFEFLQKEMKKKNVQTIDELMLRNYTFVCLSSRVKSYESMTLYTSERNLRQTESLESMLAELRTHTLDSKKFFIFSAPDLTSLVIEYEIEYNLLQQPLMMNNIVFFFPRTSFIFESFARKLSQMIEVGIAEKVTRDHDVVKNRNVKVEESGPKVLTLDHLGVGFLAWLGFLMVSLICFVLEIITRHVCKRCSQRPGRKKTIQKRKKNRSHK